MSIDWSSTTIQGAVIGAAIAAMGAAVLGGPTLVVSRRALNVARRQYELAVQERTAVYRQAHYEAVVTAALDIKQAMDDFLYDAVGRITSEQVAALERNAHVHQPLDDEARVRLRTETTNSAARLSAVVGRAGVILDSTTLEALVRVRSVFLDITAFGPWRARTSPELAEAIDPALHLANAGQAAVEALRTELHSSEMTAELKARMTWKPPEQVAR